MVWTGHMLAAELASIGVTHVPVSLDLAAEELESTKENHG